MTWIYEQHQSQTETKPADVDEDSITPPSKEEIEFLYHLAFIGGFKKIQKRITSNQIQDKQFSAFYQKVLYLSKTFQEKELINFLQQYLPPKSD